MNIIGTRVNEVFACVRDVLRVRRTPFDCNRLLGMSHYDCTRVWPPFAPPASTRPDLGVRSRVRAIDPARRPVLQLCKYFCFS